ncbi:MAG: capsular polysaccharide biosynthesis protein CapF [Clostridia bacterium]|nr:capsular polysaccharide biosynthesis protein CapF [Clostridia bacterium]
MKILVTGAKGFVGKNLIPALMRNGHEVFEFDIDTEPTLLEGYTRECEFVFHLAGVNRPKTEDEFMTGNFGFTTTLTKLLEKHANKSPILITSSIQAELDNPYGKSKKAGEDALREYGAQTGAKVLIYRLPNVFGKWCRPNYNSAVATFCHNIARDLPITINDPKVNMRLVYIDDVVDEFLRALAGNENCSGDFCSVQIVHEITLGEIAELIESFKKSRESRFVPNQESEFARKLYATYLSYLPEDNFSYPLLTHSDNRGSFTEILKTARCGQVSVNISKPHITKGNHWHNSKNEKFLVVSGTGVIRFRKFGEDKIYEYFVSSDKLEVVDIPTGYTHNIENLGESDMVTLMWANEPFDPEKPDTFVLEV